MIKRVSTIAWYCILQVFVANCRDVLPELRGAVYFMGPMQVASVASEPEATLTLSTPKANGSSVGNQQAIPMKAPIDRAILPYRALFDTLLIEI